MTDEELADIKARVPLRLSDSADVDTLLGEREDLLLRLGEATRKSQLLCQQNGELLMLLYRIKEQGLSHQCAQEGYLAKLGCNDCTANTEAEIDRVLGAQGPGEPDDWKGECLHMVKEAIENRGIDMKGCPPMFYPEAIHNLFAWGVKGALACHEAHGNRDQKHQIECVLAWMKKHQEEQKS